MFHSPASQLIIILLIDSELKNNARKTVSKVKIIAIVNGDGKKWRKIFSMNLIKDIIKKDYFHHLYHCLFLYQTFLFSMHRYYESTYH